MRRDQSSPSHPGPSIQQRREARGLSRELLAGEAGVSLRTLERIEGGIVMPRRATLAVIEAALKPEKEAA